MPVYCHTIFHKMDSNSNSNDSIITKIEPESENETETNKVSSLNDSATSFTCWHHENTMKLIKTLEKDCKELWDVKHPLNKDRCARIAKQQYLADTFGTTILEISRKIHNLRTQYNNELRKMKRRQKSGDLSVGGRWEYFDALSFLQRTPGDAGDPLEIDSVNLALAEFQAEEEEEFRVVARAKALLAASAPTPTPGVDSTPKPKHKPRVAASGPPVRQVSGVLMMSPEEAVPRLRPSMNADECQIFGDFVASELRMLRSDQSRKKLKRIIQKAILEIGEDEDMNSFNG